VGQGSGIAMSYGIGDRCGSDPMSLWLWCRVVAVVPIQPLAWELPYVVGATLKGQKKKKKKKKHSSCVWQNLLSSPGEKNMQGIITHLVKENNRFM